ncbi:MAG: WD40/YVTN/BNR-like repeat-containing protein [Acidimicrobiales bacterium]
MTSVLMGTDDGLLQAGAGEPRPIALAGHTVTGLSRGDDGWWAIVDRGELWHSQADPHHWERRTHSVEPEATCLLPTAGGLLVGTAEAGLAWLRPADEGDAGDRAGALEPVAGFERVEGRDQWYTPWGGPPDTRWLSAAGATLFANVHVGGIITSADGGRSWQPTGLDLHADVHQVLAGAAPDLVLAPCAEGLAVSTDHGRTWRIDDEGLHATYSRAVAVAVTVAGDTVVISASTGPRTDRSALYRRPLHADGAFERCRAGLPEWFTANIDTGCLVAHGATVACATVDGVFGSTDGAATWQALAEPLAPVHCLALAG